jgi:hypothetical protein
MEKDILTPFDKLETDKCISKTRHDLSERYLGRPSLRYYKERDFSEIIPDVLNEAKKLMDRFEKKYSR